MNKLLKNQKGIASIYVTVIFSIIITVVVLSFVILSRREQRLTLDRQLSAQAYYAAESGINDALATLKSNPSYTKDVCEEKALDADKFIYQTCTLVSLPTSLTYTVNTTNSKFFLVRSQTPFNTIEFTWQPLNSTDTIASSNNCPSPYPVGTPCYFKSDTLDANGWGSQMGVLRLEVIAIDRTATSIPRNLISSNTYHLFGIPDSGTNNSFSTPPYTTTNIPDSNDSAILSGKCNAQKQCTLRMAGVVGGGNYDYYVRAFSYYKDIKLTVQGQLVELISGIEQKTAVTLIGSQVVIDSTGRSGDVLRRVRVNKTLNSSSTASGLNSSTSYLPPFVLSTGDGLCKKLETNPNSTTVANSAAVCN